MSDPMIIVPKDVLNAVVTPPGSKSITNRALILASLRKNKTTLTGVLESEDTQIMYNALSQLGLPLSWDTAARQIEVFGQGGVFPNKQVDLHVGNSGTTARFLTAVLAFTDGNYRIHGKPRMHQRPIRDLVEALNSLGGNVEYETEKGFPPVLIHPYPNCITEEYITEEKGTLKGVSIPGSVSSQFLTALLLASPLAARHSALRINILGTLVSKPYVEMTLRMMDAFFSSSSGIETNENFDYFSLSPHKTEESVPLMYRIEPDASAASYFFAAAAICGGSVTVKGLSSNSLQGDVLFAECLHRMNCDVQWNTDSITISRDPDRPLRGITANMNHISDTAQTLAVVALFAEGVTEITNIEHVRFKETDRIADLATELRRFGAKVIERRDGLQIIPPKKLTPATVSTYDDHRMAMSFAIAGLRLSGVKISNPECTQKTFPNFFEVLERL